MNNTASIIIVIIIIVLVVLGIWWWWSYNSPSAVSYNTSGQTTTPAATQPAPQQGTLYLAFTDAAVNMNTISAVDMAVDKIYVHSQAQGWLTVSQNPQTSNLLDLKAGKNVVVNEQQSVPVGTYDQLWFHVSSVMVTESGKLKAAVMPSQDFKMNGIINVMANTTSTATLDILADQSLHKTSSGQFVFAPVVNFESRSGASVTFSKALITISGGTITATASAGMDVDGTVKDNFKLSPNVDLGIKNGLIQINGNTSNSTNNPGTSSGTNTNVNINTGY